MKIQEENGLGKNINELQVYQTPSRQIYNSIEKNKALIQMNQQNSGHRVQDKFE